MAPSKVDAVLNGQEMSKAVAGVDSDDKFAPSVWGDFFVSYVPPISQACIHMPLI